MTFKNHKINYDLFPSINLNFTSFVNFEKKNLLFIITPIKLGNLVTL